MGKNRYSPLSSLYFPAIYFINLVLSALNVVFLPVLVMEEYCCWKAPGTYWLCKEGVNIVNKQLTYNGELDLLFCSWKSS